jgi:hypothetical protein
MKPYLVLALASCATSVTEEPPSDASSEPSSKPDSGTTIDASVDVFDDTMVEMDSNESSSSCAMPFSGTLAIYDFMGEPGNQASTVVKSTATGVVASNLNRSMALTPVAGVNSINSSNWSTGALDKTRYYGFSLTPPAGCALDVTTIALSSQASGTGPAAASIASSDDNFTKTTVFTIGITMVAHTVMNATSALDLRIYGYNASATGGTFRLTTTLTVTGAVK